MRRLAVLAPLPLLGGCYAFVSGVGSGIDEAAFDLARVVLGSLGVAGVVMIVVAARRPVDRLALTLYWALGLVVVGVSAWSTNFFNPWPGAFRQREIWFLWLPLPLALAPLVATGRFALARTSNRAGRPIAAAATVSGLGYVGALAHASHAVLPIAFTQTVTELVVTDSWSFGRTEAGTVLTMSPTRELPGKHRAIAGDSSGALAIDENGDVVVLAPRGPLQRLAIAAPVRSIAVGPKFQCAADAAGHLVCFDAFSPASERETLGFGPKPLQLEGFDAVVEVAVSDALICARSQDAKTRCAAGNPSQRVVAEITSAPGEPHLLWDGSATAVAVTQSSACIVDAGDVYCAGENDWGELGPDRGSSRALRIAGVSQVRQLVAGTFHLCALQQDGAVLCWGGNGWGQLGGTAGSPKSRPSPERVSLPGRAVALFRHSTSTCARLEDKALFCWGAQRQPGRLVTGETCDKPFFLAPMTCSKAPVRIEQPTTFIPTRGPD